MADPSPAIRALAQCILLQAIVDLRASQTRRWRPQSHPARAHAWFLDDGEAWPFSFANVCLLLGLRATTVRATLGVGKDQR